MYPKLGETPAAPAQEIFDHDRLTQPVRPVEARQPETTQPAQPPRMAETEYATEEAAEPAATITPARELLATNTGVRLACTMSAMLGLFAIFLCWAEQESRVIRHFSLQSACLTVLHALVGGAALVISLVLGAIPYVGLMVTLGCLLVYIAALIWLIFTRVRLMRCAWQGVRFLLPAALEKIIRRYD